MKHTTYPSPARLAAVRNMLVGCACLDIFAIEFEQIPEDQRVTWEGRAPTAPLCVDSGPSPGSDSSDNENNAEALPSSGHTIALFPSADAISTTPERSKIQASIAASPPFRPRAHIANSQFMARLILKTGPTPCNSLSLSFRMYPASGCRFINAILTLTFRRCDGRADTTLRVRTIGKTRTVPHILTKRKGGLDGRPFPIERKAVNMRIDPAVDGYTPRCAWIIEGNLASPREAPEHSLLMADLEQMKGSTFEVELEVCGEFGFRDIVVPVAVKRGAGLVWIVDMDESGQMKMARKVGPDEV